MLRAAGYQTAMIGKWHMHPFPSDEFEYLSHTWMRMSAMKSPDVLKTGPSKGDYTLPAEGAKKKRGKKKDPLLDAAGDGADRFLKESRTLNVEWRTSDAGWREENGGAR